MSSVAILDHHDNGNGAVARSRGDDLTRRHRSQAGAIGGLSDTALAVVVGTLTLVGVVGFFQTSSSGAKTNSEIANLTNLVAAIRTAYYQAGSTYAGISNLSLATSRIAPAPLIRGTSLTPLAALSMSVDPVAVGASDTEFSVTYNGLAPDACTKLVGQAWSSFSDMVSSNVNAAGAITSAPTMSALTDACSKSGNNNTVVLTFN